MQLHNLFGSVRPSMLKYLGHWGSKASRWILTLFISLELLVIRQVESHSPHQREKF